MGDRLGTAGVVGFFFFFFLFLAPNCFGMFLPKYIHKMAFFRSILCLRPYHTQYTSSRLITEVKQCRACSVLGWVTAWFYEALLGLLNPIDKNFDVWIYTFHLEAFEFMMILCPCEYTSSRLTTEVKQCRACSVLGWVTAWEQQVL